MSEKKVEFVDKGNIVDPVFQDRETGSSRTRYKVVVKDVEIHMGDEVNLKRQMVLTKAKIRSDGSPFTKNIEKEKEGKTYVYSFPDEKSIIIDIEDIPPLINMMKEQYNAVVKESKKN